MAKIKNFLLEKLPFIGFVAFAYGGMMFVLGHNFEVPGYMPIGFILGAIGFFVFVWGNMILEERNEGEQE